MKTVQNIMHNTIVQNKNSHIFYLNQILFMSRKYTNKSLLNLIEYRSGSGSDTQYLNYLEPLWDGFLPRIPVRWRGSSVRHRSRLLHAMGLNFQNSSVRDPDPEPDPHVFWVRIHKSEVRIRSASKCHEAPTLQNR